MKTLHTFATLLLSLTLVAGCSKAASAPLQSLKPPVITVSGSGTALPLVQKLADAYVAKHPEARFQFESGTNSGGAVLGVANGTLSLAVVNRPLTAQEATIPLTYTPFACDAVVFAVNRSTAATAISTEQIRQAYSGKLASWASLSGQKESIMLLDRDEDESARKLVFLKLMGDVPVQGRTIVLSSAGDMLASLRATPYALGYTSLGLIRINGASDLQPLTLDGVVPSPATIHSGAYPWCLTFGLVYPQNPHHILTDFVAFTKGAEGRAILESYDYAGVEG